MHALLALLLAGQGAAFVPYRWTSAAGTAFATTLKGVRYGPEGATDLAAGDFDAETIVSLTPGGLRFSLDEGANWRPAPSAPPEARGGGITVSSEGRTWVWSLPIGSCRTEDYGFVWTPCEGVPAGLRVVADRTSPARFYAVDPLGDRLFVSEDGARHFRERPLRLKVGTQGTLFPTSGRSGDLWLATSGYLYHAPVGREWAQMPLVSEVRALGFGKGIGIDPALYIVGTVAGLPGVYRSVDEAKSWARIADNPTGVVFQISGDPKRFGRVYLGILGSGVKVGNPK